MKASSRQMGHKETGNRWVKQTRQVRSKETQEALIQAALTLFKKYGFDQVSVTDIAKEAGCSAASIYRRFSDREGLNQAAHEYFTDEALKILRASARTNAFDGLSLEELLRAMAGFLWKFAKENQVFLQASYVRALSNPQFARRFVEVRREVFASLREHFLRRREEITHPNPEIAIDFALRQAMATLTYRIEAVQLEIGLEPLPDGAFIEEVVRAFLSYVSPTEPPRITGARKR